MSLWRVVGRRTSTYFVVIAASAFFVERTLTVAADALYDSINKGVSSR